MFFNCFNDFNEFTMTNHPQIIGIAFLREQGIIIQGDVTH